MSFNDASFDDSILYGMRQVAKISEESFGKKVRATSIVRPHKLKFGPILSTANMMLAFMTFATSFVYLWIFAPSFEKVWKIKESLVLCLISIMGTIEVKL